MGSCKFTNELNRLRKSSSDSIDHVERFDEFKKYMHITRTTEKDLKDILRRVNVSGKKTLVLLCGSAGDGKSHLLSFLKNSDEERLIDNYVVYNDATESSAPSMTAIQTLNNLLDSFKDYNLDLPGQNVILAINLGVLSNFIESEYGASFSILKEYVENSDILTTKIKIKDFDEESHFQHISFSDYHMYSLTEEGIHTGYIEKIFEKIFGQKDENVFYKSYQNDCTDCPLSQKCPVKRNYEYLMEQKRQKYVAELLIKAKNKISSQIDFSKTKAEICSIVIFTEELDVSYLYKTEKKLVFELKASDTICSVEVECRLKNRDVRLAVPTSADWENYSISLSEFGGGISEWQALKEIKFLLRRNDTIGGNIEIRNLKIK